MIEHLIRTHGAEHMVLTLRVLTETHPANRSHLNRHVITAVNAMCCFHRQWTSPGLPFLEAWDSLVLGALRELATACRLRRHHLWSVLYVILVERLAPMLDPLTESKLQPTPVKLPPKPPRSITRIPEVEAKLQLGNKLLQLKAATSTGKFGAKPACNSRLISNRPARRCAWPACTMADARSPLGFPGRRWSSWHHHPCRTIFARSSSSVSSRASGSERRRSATPAAGSATAGSAERARRSWSLPHFIDHCAS
ncbi:hypothetical protein [Bradyrhizobium sp. Cp5.3]|uniref:hypothetical protein n=1 Tax=Bradyrhizobium sp. Cp5.3 TaxID=443598 RepID=UPI0005548FEF|nr:hypothetical protein [Bradyrhizobium sp. Cp5.3]